MSSVAEIEAAIRRLDRSQQTELMGRLEDLAEEIWDDQISADASSGRLDALIAEVESDISAGRVEPLDEVIDHS